MAKKFRCACEVASMEFNSFENSVCASDDGYTDGMCVDDGNEDVHFHDDPYFIINNKTPVLDPSSSDKYIDSLKQSLRVSQDKYSELPQDVKDGVFASVRSRYIQSPADLRQYINKLQFDIDVKVGDMIDKAQSNYYRDKLKDLENENQ